MRYQDNVFIVTGSSKEIGEGITRIFWREGANVVVISRNTDGGQKG